MPRSRHVRPSIAPLLCTLALASALIWDVSPAHAQEVSAENKAAARDLATEGIKLAQAGKCEEAIPQLLRAEELFHAPTILTWVGQCQLELGRYVEGTETLNRVIREKIERTAPEAYLNAQVRARDLVAQAKPKIGKLVINVSPEDVDGLTVTVGGQPVSSALIGAPRPTDPGKHLIEVTAPGYTPKTQEILLGEGESEKVSFELEMDGATDALAQDSTPGARPDQTNKSPSRVLGWVTLGVGGALMAGGGVMGYVALSKKNDLACDDNRSCPPSEENNLNAARTSATVSTVLFGVGGAAAVTGVVLLLTGKSKADAEEISARQLVTPGVRPYVGIGTLGVNGRF